MASAYTVFVGIGTAGTYVTGVFMGETLFRRANIFFDRAVGRHYWHEDVYKREQCPVRG
jgi:hypothetical protein